MPCVEWFEEQDRAYRETVLPPAVQARVSVEAGIALTWYRYLGDAGRVVSASSTSAPPPTTRCSTASSASPPRPSVAAAHESLADANR